LERPESLVEGRTVFYLRQLEQVAPYLPEKARYVAADGYYAKKLSQIVRLKRRVSLNPTSHP
jgi:hypothetical protein